MRKFLFFCLILIFIGPWRSATGQSVVDDRQFFLDTTMLDVTISTDLTRLIRKNSREDTMDAVFNCVLPDGSVVREKIGMTLRGDVRRSICGMPPIKLHFRKSDSSRLHKLKTIKLVNACRYNFNYEQWLFREYLTYKIYNQLTDMSFRVRLLRITYEDTEDRKKPAQSYAFLIEDVDEMAKRNDCKELNVEEMKAATCDRRQRALFYLFQYMIGNVDWAIHNLHNIKLIIQKGEDNPRPLLVPYDFDYCGLVNASYAVPDPNLGTEKVTERIYRGFPLSQTDMDNEFSVFNSKKDSIYSLVENFELLHKANKKEVIRFLDRFYQIINDPDWARNAFVYNAREF